LPLRNKIKGKAGNVSNGAPIDTLPLVPKYEHDLHRLEASLGASEALHDFILTQFYQ
jgi:hypothetical protein